LPPDLLDRAAEIQEYQRGSSDRTKRRKNSQEADAEVVVVEEEVVEVEDEVMGEVAEEGVRRIDTDGTSTGA